MGPHAIVQATAPPTSSMRARASCEVTPLPRSQQTSRAPAPQRMTRTLTGHLLGHWPLADPHMLCAKGGSTLSQVTKLSSLVGGSQFQASPLQDLTSKTVRGSEAVCSCWPHTQTHPLHIAPQVPLEAAGSVLEHLCHHLQAG